MQPYPQNIEPTFPSVVNALQDISRKRQEDITDRNTFNSIFVNGRKVGKVPSGSADVVASDRIGDLNITKDYIYTCCDDGAGGAVWRRQAQSAW